MPVDPSISLNVAGGGGPSAPALPGASFNPLAAMGAFTDLQNKMNTNQQFQQTFSARKKLGEILANSPDMETGLVAAAKDPTIAGWGAPAINEIRQMQQTLVDTHGKQATQSRDAFGAWLTAAASAGLADPGTIGKITESQLAGMPASVRQSVLPMIRSATQALYDRLPDDPVAAKRVHDARLTGMAVGAGIKPDALQAILGTPKMEVAGNRIVPGVQMPAQLGGGFTPSGPTIGVGAPPGMSTVGETPVPHGGIAPDGSMGGGSAAPGPIYPTSTGSPPGAGGPPTGGPRVGAGAPAGNSITVAPVEAPPMAGTGKPLWGPDGPGLSPVIKRGAGVAGANVLSPAQNTLNAQLLKEYGNEGMTSYNSAVQSLANMHFMDNALDNLVKGGGFLQPGTAAQLRLDMAKAYNTFKQLTGSTEELPTDPSKIASMEEFNKDTVRLGAMVTKQFFGGQREAASTIDKIISSVPNISNTYMGGKLVLAGLRSQAQRVIDERTFENAWVKDPRNQGNLIGAAEAFNKLHPAQDYAKQVLDAHGLSDKGLFKSPQDVGAAVQHGYLNKDQAKKILQDQFNMQ